MGSTVQQQITIDSICSIWSTSSGDRTQKKKKGLTSGSLEARNTSYISYICITHFSFFFFLNPPEAVNQVLIREMETYKDEFSTLGVGRALVGGFSNEIWRGGAPRWDSAFHPKILCELLDLQQIFGVNCGTGGGQGALHVRLQANRPARSDVSFKFSSDLHDLNRLNS